MHGQRRSATLELVMWGPVLLYTLGAVTVPGRLAPTHRRVEAAAPEAALADDLAAANTAGETLALPVAGLGLAFLALLAVPALLRIVAGM